MGILHRRLFSLMRGCLLVALLAQGAVRSDSNPPASEKKTAPWVSPSALALSADGQTLFVASATSGQVLVFDTTQEKVVREIRLTGAPSGLALSSDGRLLFVTCAAPKGQLAVIDTQTSKVLRSVRLGHTPISPVAAPDGRTVYVCNRFNNNVSVVDVARGEEIRRIDVEREPVAAAITLDGKFLLVGNHLPVGRADAGTVAAHVSVIDTAAGTVIRQLPLPNGGNLVRDIRVSPDGRYACVTHVLARFYLPTTQLERGWMNSNALTLIDIATISILNTVLLDQVDRGAANPWGACWSNDGRSLLVAHAGTHEVSLIDAAGLLKKLGESRRAPEVASGQGSYAASSVNPDPATDLAYLVGLRQIVKLNGKGPRAIVLRGSRAYVADYFSESIERLDLASQPARPVEIPLRAARPMSIERRGEFLFNDASICFQAWQSCASCHSSDARVDGLNWDLLNDGIGNPKNSKSLLLSHQTPPAMSMGVRDTAEMAVRAGIAHILFTVQPEEVPTAIDQWLKSLTPEPSPYLVDGKLSLAARRGRGLFNSSETRCAECHKPGLFTDLHSHDVGTVGPYDQKSDVFDTPTLVELWRTAPYLHDGSAATIAEVLVQRNQGDHHGKTSHLSVRQIEDLAAYILSL